MLTKLPFTASFWLKITPTQPKWRRDCLKTCGYDVVIAESVRTALETAGRLEITLALCDIGLPDGDGCDLMRELHSRSLRSRESP